MSASQQFQSWESAVRWLREQPDQQRLVQACYYDRPLSRAAERYWQSAEWQAIRGLLPGPPGAALDVGAGHGITSYALARDRWSVVALEPDPSPEVGVGAIWRLAQATRLPIEVVQGVGERIPAEADRFDLVFARQSLHHADDLARVCGEIARVLTCGGRLVAAREHVISAPADLQRFRERHPLHRLYGGENAFLLREYLDAFQAAGLRVLRVIKPLECVVNYAPLDESGVRDELLRRIEGGPGGRIVSQLLRASGPAYRAFKAVAMGVDNRPGRLYTFICEKRNYPA